MTDETKATATPEPAPAAVVTSTVAQPTVTTSPAQPDLQAVANALLADIPENLRGLIPKVDPAQQINWFVEAKKTGVFSTGAPVVPQTDSGKPTVTPIEPNLNDLPPMARMSRGYGQ